MTTTTHSNHTDREMFVLHFIERSEVFHTGIFHVKTTGENVSVRFLSRRKPFLVRAEDLASFDNFFS